MKAAKDPYLKEYEQRGDNRIHSHDVKSQLYIIPLCSVAFLRLQHFIMHLHKSSLFKLLFQVCGSFPARILEAETFYCPKIQTRFLQIIIYRIYEHKIKEYYR